MYGISEQTPADPRTWDEKQEDIKNTYPNYCGYPKFAVIPGETFGEDNASGEDLYIDGYCLYEQPAVNNVDYKSSGIWLPYTGNTKIAFYNQEIRQKMYKRYKNYLSKVGGTLDSTMIEEQVNNLYRDGLVYQFEIEGVRYVPALTYAPDFFRIAFAGFYIPGLPQSEDTKYKGPKWVDKRSDYDKFIDRYGLAIQLSVAALTIIAAPFTAGSSLALWLEIGLELGVGIPVAIREWQRGDRVDSAFSTITALLPMLKLSKFYLGYSKETWDSLGRFLKTAPPSTSSETQFAEWLSKMDIEDRKLLNQLTKDDGYHMQKLLTEVENSMSGYLSVGLYDDIKLALNKNPSLADEFKFWKTVGGKDLKSNLIAGGISLIVNLVWGDIINKDDAGKLDKLWLELPERYKPEFYDNVMNNPEKIPEIINNPDINDIKNEFGDEMDNFGKFFGDAIKTIVKDSLGNDYVDTGTDFTALENEKYDETQLDSLAKEGWVILTQWQELYPGEQPTGMKYINDDLYLKANLPNK